MLRVQLKGQQQITAVLTGVGKALDTVAILDESGALLYNRIRTRFLQQQDPDGSTWVESWSAKQRRERGVGGGTLFDTGTLFRSIQLHKVGADSRAISTDVPYAPDHNLGINNQRQRVFLGFGREDASVVTQLILKRFSEALR